MVPATEKSSVYQKFWKKSIPIALVQCRDGLAISSVESLGRADITLSNRVFYLIS